MSLLLLNIFIQKEEVMVRHFTRLAVLASLFLAIPLAQPFQHASARSSAQTAPGAGERVSPQGFLNPDGSLRLDGSLSGSLDLSGWEVSIDPQRGPLFAPAESGETAVPASG